MVETYDRLEFHPSYIAWLRCRTRRATWSASSYIAWLGCRLVSRLAVDPRAREVACGSPYLGNPIRKAPGTGGLKPGGSGFLAGTQGCGFLQRGDWWAEGEGARFAASG